jgi:iron complex transport system substrate-binding protein
VVPLKSRLQHTVLLAAALVACRPAGSTPPGMFVVDDAGDTARLSVPPRRIVSLNPAITELVFALGAGHRLVGRSDECDYPEAARDVPSVGGWLPPNVEAVVATTPDLVLLYGGPTNATAAARLRALGIPVLSFRTDHLADVSRLARLLGPLLGAIHPADSLASSYDAALDSSRSSITIEPKPSVVLLAWDQPLIVLGAGSYVSELVELAGGRNVFGDLQPASVPMSLETVASRAPTALVTVGGLSGRFAERPEWQAVPAVRQHHILELTESTLKWPSPRAPAAIAALRLRLHSAGLSGTRRGGTAHGQ